MYGKKTYICLPKHRLLLLFIMPKENSDKKLWIIFKEIFKHKIHRKLLAGNKYEGGLNHDYKQNTI